MADEDEEMPLAPSTLPGDSPGMQLIYESLSRLKERLVAIKEEQRPALAKISNHFKHQFHELIEEAKNDVGELTVGGQAILEQSLRKVDGPLSASSSAHRTAHTCVSRIGKDIEKQTARQLSALFKNQKRLTHPEAPCKIICDYLTTIGQTQTAVTLCKDAGLYSLENDVMQRREEIDEVMEKLKNREVGPARVWVAANHPSDRKLKLDIDKMNLIKLMQQGKRLEAIAFSRRHMSPMMEHDDELGEVMGALFAPPDSQRYQKNFSDEHWHELEKSVSTVLSRTSSNLNDLLSVGIRAVPSLMNLRSMVCLRSDFLFGSEELPIEISLPSHVHSTFTCPILRQQSTDSNPPMRLACGHVISRDAMTKLSQTTRVLRLKCPYCPLESSPNEARQVYF